MPTTDVAAHFTRKDPVVRAIYDRLVDVANEFGSVSQEPKKTSIHLTRKTAFAGVATRRDALILTLKSDTDIQSPRIFKREQASARRWYLEVKLTDPKQVDQQLARWLERAMALSG